MSENIQNQIVYAKERWPVLQNFFSCYLHQDWSIHHGSTEASLDQAISDYDRETLKSVMREWTNWKQRVWKKTDPRESLNYGLGINIDFRFPSDARKLVKMVDEKLAAVSGIAQQNLGQAE
ncbi:contact-dependent growth inhibition system immunity protein [Parasphingorhabdus sp.]|uniref:contact-dependent growth inhibition system immunity protein n=1 Tax=Parasphingorhabdus sp. TaxID=2709688 RepID=UPI003D2CAEB1